MTPTVCNYLQHFPSAFQSAANNQPIRYPPAVAANMSNTAVKKLNGSTLQAISIKCKGIIALIMLSPTPKPTAAAHKACNAPANTPTVSPTLVQFNFSAIHLKHSSSIYA